MLLENLTPRLKIMSDAEKTVEYIIRPIGKEDRQWVAHFLDEHWGSTQIVTRGNAYYGHLLPGYIAEVAGEKIGLVTYNIADQQCEITTLDSMRENEGVGTVLLEKVQETAREAGCKRLWLITTNDNLTALRFWQKKGFELVFVHRGAIAEARRLKPQIPLVGIDDIPIRDEIELEMKI